MRRSCQAVCAASLLLALSFPAPAFSAPAQSVERASAGRISIHAEKRPLGEILRELKTVIDIELLLITSKAEKQVVSLSLEDTLEVEALWAILDAANVDGVVWGGKGKPYRVFAGSLQSSIDSKRIQLSTPEQPAASPGGERRATSPAEKRRSEDDKPTGVRPDRREPEMRPGKAPPLGQRLPALPRIATGDASLPGVPGASQLARLGAILGLGLLMGLALVVRDS